MDTVNFLMEYENGELDHDQIVAGFQELVNSGLVWRLQGSYGRVAQNLIERGEVTV